MKINILGVKIDKVNLTEALAAAEKWIWNPGPDTRLRRYRGSPMNEIHREKHYIVTPNLEFILAAQKDREFREILNKADLGLPDSSRLGLSYWLLGKSRLERLLLWPLLFFPTNVVMQFDVVTGIDFMEALCKLSAEKGFTTGFLGGKDEVAKKTAECLKKKYPNLKVSFASSGGEVDNNGSVIASPEGAWQSTPEDPSSAFGGLRMTGAVDILFVAFGHIKQEKWIAKNLEDTPVHVAMGVGGAFDYISGSVPRAPKWIRSLGFEWLLRLVVQPWRIKRQLVLLRYLWLLLFNDYH